MKKKEYSCISIDVIRCCIEANPVFAYQIVLHTTTKESLPIVHMLCEKNNKETVNDWLFEVSKILNPPKEIIMDQSPSLLSATVTAFTQLTSVNEYLDCCHQIINGQIGVDLPKSFIRHDMSNIVQKLKKEKVFNKMDKRVKRFYLLAIGTLFQIEIFEDVKNVVNDILLLCLTEMETSWTDSTRERLKKQIETHNVGIHYSDNEDEVEENAIEEDEDLEIVLEWYFNLKVSVSRKINQNGNNYNMLFFSSVEPWFQKLIHKLPTWSAIMRSTFKSENKNVYNRSCTRNEKTPQNVEVVIIKVVG